MRGRPGCLLQSAEGEANRILLATALSSMRIICPKKVSRCDWIIAASLGWFVSLRTSSFWTNWYHLMPSSMRIHQVISQSLTRLVQPGLGVQQRLVRPGLGSSTEFGATGPRSSTEIGATGPRSSTEIGATGPRSSTEIGATGPRSSTVYLCVAQFCSVL